MASETDLASHLQRWAITEMHFYSQGATVHKLPTVEDFKELCRGRNASIWKWVLAHVHSKETVKTVKGNLTIKNKTSTQPYKVKYGEEQEAFDTDRCDLLNRRAQLTGEITTVLRDISHLKSDLARIEEEIAEKEHMYRKQTSEIGSTRRKAALLAAYSNKSADTRAQYEEYTKGISSRVDNIRQRAQKSLGEEEYYSKGVNQENMTDSPALETACGANRADPEIRQLLEEPSDLGLLNRIKKNVRESCESIGTLLQETLKGTFGGDKTEFARQKEPLWQQVEMVTRTFASDQILGSLLTNTRDTCSNLRDMTDHVDIRKDAKSLRFKYEPSGLVQDLATPPSLLRSVHLLLQDRTTEHLKRFIEAQKCSNLARNLEQTVTTTRAHIEKRLTKLFAQKTKDLQLARYLLEAEVELEGLRASLNCLIGEAERLREIVERSHKERQELFTKYHRIQEFQQLTDKKQNLIQVLVKQNMNSQNRLDSQIAEIELYVQRSLKSHESQIQTVSVKLHHCINTEVQQFANLSLPYLMFSQIDNALKTAVIDLSVNLLSPATILPALQTVLHCLGFPSFQAPEMVFKRCLELKSEIEEITYKLERENWANQWRKKKDGEKDVAVVIADLCEAMRVEDERQMEKTLPVLQDRVTRTTMALSKYQHTRQMVKSWWEQPGQTCVPWITVDGHNLQHYMEKWTLLATGLRQALVK